MPRKKKDEDEHIIIGYNANKMRNNPPKKKPNIQVVKSGSTNKKSGIQKEKGNSVGSKVSAQKSKGNGQKNNAQQKRSGQNVKSNVKNDYIYVVTWEDFLKYPQVDMDLAFSHKESTPLYKVVKTV